MKIDFEDKSYIEMTKSDKPNKVFITIAAKSADNSYQLIANCVEINKEELLALVKSIS